MAYYTHVDKLTGKAVELKKSEADKIQKNTLPWSERKMLERQSEIISELNKLNRDYSAVMKYKQGHDMYMLLQNAALSDDTIMEAFQHLMMLIKLSASEDIPGLTSKQKGTY